MFEKKITKIINKNNLLKGNWGNLIDLLIKENVTQYTRGHHFGAPRC